MLLYRPNGITAVVNGDVITMYGADNAKSGAVVIGATDKDGSAQVTINIKFKKPSTKSYSSFSKTPITVLPGYFVEYEVTGVPFVASSLCSATGQGCCTIIGVSVGKSGSTVQCSRKTGTTPRAGQAESIYVQIYGKSNSQNTVCLGAQCAVVKVLSEVLVSQTSSVVTTNDATLRLAVEATTSTSVAPLCYVQTKTQDAALNFLPSKYVTNLNGKVVISSSRMESALHCWYAIDTKGKFGGGQIFTTNVKTFDKCTP